MESKKIGTDLFYMQSSSGDMTKEQFGMGGGDADDLEKQQHLSHMFTI